MTRKDFLLERRSGIGGSDAPVVMGLSRWKSPYQLWLDKTSPLENQEEAQESDVLHFGSVLEQVVADEYARRNGVKLQNRSGVYRHKDHPELIGHIDRLIVPEGGILECKTSGAYRSALWGESGTDQVPEDYLVQVTHYMYVTGKHEAALAVLIGGQEYRQYEIKYDKELAEAVAAKCCEFWRKYVVGNTPPPPSEADDLAAYYRGRGGRPVTATPHIADIVKSIKDFKKIMKAQEELVNKLSGELKIYMGENFADVLLDADGECLATWRQNRNRMVAEVNWDAFLRERDIREEELDPYTKYEVRMGARPLLIK